VENDDPTIAIPIILRGAIMPRSLSRSRWS